MNRSAVVETFKVKLTFWEQWRVKNTPHWRSLFSINFMLQNKYLHSRSEQS